MNKKDSQFKFKRSSNFPFRIVEGEVVLVSPQEGEVTVLNEIAAKIWQLLDGKRTPRSIANVLASEFEVEKEEAYTDCLNFLKELEQKGFVKNVS